jgi:hypothetical protein
LLLKLDLRLYNYFYSFLSKPGRYLRKGVGSSGGKGKDKEGNYFPRG